MIGADDRFIAVDWGTTNRRCYLIDQGRAVKTERDDTGVKALLPQDYPAQIAAIRDRLGDLPILLAGMVGSTVGWRDAPYIDAPASLAALASSLLWIDARTAIVPGVCFRDDDRPDVMRGEEVQLLGAVEAGLAPSNALLVQPGTHCKWAVMKNGAIASFRTAITGELFALLGEHSLLASQMSDPVDAGDAFSRGVMEGRRRDLAASLFVVRSSSVLGTAPLTKNCAAYVSGLLIGADVTARVAEHDARTVHVLADPRLGALYATALRAEGRIAIRIDSHGAFVAGVTKIWRLIS
jgi:2-dehydro-3-deoxygalactonokinase